MSDQIQLLKYIKETVDKIDAKLDKHDTRIVSLERTRTHQGGIMLGGGAVVTFFAGIAAWVVDRIGTS